MVNRVKPKRDLVLLGASNLTMSLATVAQMALEAAGPLRFWVGCGHGRSYGIDSSVMGRGLSGLIDCGVFEALAAERDGVVHALITDIGNDVLYGQSSERILSWIRSAVERLAPAEVAVTALPIKRLARLRPAGYAVMARLLFPTHRMGYERMLETVHDLQSGLEAMQREGAVRLIEQPGRWYGLDPIHIRRRFRPEAFALMLNACGFKARAARPSSAVRRAVGRSRPRAWTRWGRKRSQDQPCVRLPDGSPLHRY